MISASETRRDRPRLVVTQRRSGGKRSQHAWRSVGARERGDVALRERTVACSLLAPLRGAVRAGVVARKFRWLHHRLISFEPPARSSHERATRRRLVQLLRPRPRLTACLTITSARSRMARDAPQPLSLHLEPEARKRSARGETPGTAAATPAPHRRAPAGAREGTAPLERAQPRPHRHRKGRLVPQSSRLRRSRPPAPRPSRRIPAWRRLRPS